MRLVFNANTVGDFKRELNQIKTQGVLERWNGRTKDQVERYDIATLLSSLERANFIIYPVGLFHRDRPDFLLTMGNKNIGVEHTEAVSQNEAHKDFLRKNVQGPQAQYISPVPPNELKKNREILEKEIKANPPGNGWDGCSAEDQWARLVLLVIRKKLGKIKNPGFRKFNENWLLIYENLSLPAIEAKRAVYQLRQLIKDMEANDLKEFEYIYVINDQVVVRIKTSSLCVTLLVSTQRVDDVF